MTEQEPEILKGLNDEQKAAVVETEGFIRVVAGAGSGKTRALSHRYAYLVNEIGITPANILCVTFTNKAANEMKQRIRKLIGDGDLGHVCTFHAFCVTVLKEEINTLCFPKAFVVLDAEDENAILTEVYEERGLTSRDMTFGKARDMIEIIKCLDIPDYYDKMLAMTLDELKRIYVQAETTRDIIFWGYVYHQKKSFGLDYNDLIILTLHIFDEHKDIKLKWQSRLEYIMIDEFQDIDAQQYQLAEVLCDYHKNLFIVGDPDQTVYTWRGANVRYINEFDQKFPNVKTLYLNKNYRSTPEIINTANSLISHNQNRIEKNLEAVRESGVRAVYNHCRTSEDEAKWIADKLTRYIECGAKPSDIAILYRAHHVSRLIEEEFIKRNINYILFSGTQFYCRAEIKTTLSYLRMAAYKDDLSFMRVINTPKRNIGERRMKFLKAYSEDNGCTLYEALKLTLEDEIWKKTSAEEFIDLIEKYYADKGSRSISEILSGMLSDSGYEEMLRTSGDQIRLDNLAELKQAVHTFETTCGEETGLEDYLSQIALYTSSDADSKKDAVRMMTIHAAKGLEFPYVFLCGMSEGIFPSKLTNTKEKLEEERRLAYVAVTRARDALMISDGEGYNHDSSFRYPSRFVLNIDRKYIDYEAELDEKLIFDADFYIGQNEKVLLFDINSTEFKVGDRVRHAVMGSGTITGIDEVNLCYIISFDGLKTTRNISIRVKLTRE